MDLWGVTMLAGALARYAAARGGAPAAALGSRPAVTAGVRGGEWTADCGGDGWGDGKAEPAGSLRDGVVDPEGTYCER